MLTTSTKYALRALLYLSACPPESFVSIQTLSAETEVPRPYLAKIMKTLSVKNVVDTKKGLNGGVRISPERTSLTLLDVADALDDPVVRDTCFLSKGVCGGEDPCAFHNKWGAMREKMRQFLANHRIKG